MSLRDEFLNRAYQAAIEAGHVFPEVAACEAALESAWGSSRLAREANNLFGEKQHAKPIYENYVIGTWEDDNKNGIPDPNEYHRAVVFVKFPDWGSCLRQRMATVRRLATLTDDHGKLLYPGYAAALCATTGEEWVTEVSKDWATDARRAQKVLSIYAAHKEALT